MTRPPPHLPGSYLVLELSGRCDLACVHCAQSDPEDRVRRPRGFLDPALLDALLQDLAAVGARFDTLILFWLGEPLLHPHFGSMYATILRANARHRTFGRVEVHTNATRLDPARIRVALNAAATPQTWHLTLDATRADTWRRIKGRRGFDEVERAVAALVAEKGRRGAPWPRLVLQFIVSDRNVDEAAPFRYRWTRVLREAGLRVQVAAGHVPPGPGDEGLIFFRQLDCPTPEEQGRQNQVFRTTARALGLPLPDTEVAPARVEAANPHPCSGHWKSPVIRWDGELTVCTRDAGLALGLGNIGATPFSRLWWGPVQAARRRRVAAGDYRDLPPCGGCFIPRSANYTDISALEIRRHRAWEEQGNGREPS